LADLVVIDADLLNASDEELLTMGNRVVLTVVGGKASLRGTGSSRRGWGGSCERSRAATVRSADGPLDGRVVCK
jgi:hypothetical protein